jgi:ElaB/YqjD/DUF883 family membrane-anchored ribosome-binding protein
MSIESANHLIDQAAIATDDATAHAYGAAQRSVAAVRNSSQQLLDRAQQASDSTVAYIKDEPVKSMLIAAAAGAALAALVSLLTRPHPRA